jgi:hypothetical protein
MNDNTISVKEFRELGFLQELNRQFLHPLGLALEVRVDSDGNETLGDIWDFRTDPTGIFYGIALSPNKANYVEELRKSKIEARKNLSPPDNNSPFFIDAAGHKVVMNDNGIQQINQTPQG